MPLIYPESLVKIFQLEIGEIVADRLLISVFTNGSMHGYMDDRNCQPHHAIKTTHIREWS